MSENRDKTLANQWAWDEAFEANRDTEIKFDTKENTISIENTEESESDKKVETKYTLKQYILPKGVDLDPFKKELDKEVDRAIDLDSKALEAYNNYLWPEESPPSSGAAEAKAEEKPMEQPPQQPQPEQPPSSSSSSTSTSSSSSSSSDAAEAKTEAPSEEQPPPQPREEKINFPLLLKFANQAVPGFRNLPRPQEQEK